MTIEIPTPSAELVAQLETVTIEIEQGETAAVAALRQRFAGYAKHAGYIKTGSYDMLTSNYSVDREAFYERDGKRVHGLLALHAFSTPHRDQNRGDCTGFRLYLTDAGEWLELRRVGRWTRWQGEAQWWYTDAASSAAVLGANSGEDSAEGESGHIRVLTDAEVQAEYEVSNVVKQFAESMAELCKKLPERYNRLKASAELAQRVVAAAAEVK